MISKLDFYSFPPIVDAQVTNHYRQLRLTVPRLHARPENPYFREEHLLYTSTDIHITANKALLLFKRARVEVEVAPVYFIMNLFRLAFFGNRMIVSLRD